MARHSTLWSGGVSEILLCAYSTMPLIVDLYVSAAALRPLPFSLSANLVNKTWGHTNVTYCNWPLGTELILHNLLQLHTHLPILPQHPQILPLLPTPILPQLQVRSTATRRWSALGTLQTPRRAAPGRQSRPLPSLLLSRLPS